MKFIDQLTDDCRRHGVKLVLASTRSVTYNSVEVNGYFIDHPTPTLACACGQPEPAWLGTLVHESCHMDQWLDRSKYWLDGVGPNGREFGDLVFDWLAREVEATDEELDIWCTRALQLEADCERRAVEKIKTLGIDLDPHLYARRANAYIWSWAHVRETRTWYKIGQEPYNIPAIYMQLADTIGAPETYWPISPQARQLLEQIPRDVI